MIKIEHFTFNPFQENTYILSNQQGKAIVIDPGMYFTAEQESFDNFIQKAGLIIEKVVNTHCHLDHIFSVKYVAEKYKVPVYIPSMEKEWLLKGEEQGTNFGLPFETYKGDCFLLKEGEQITLGEEDILQVINVAGHSPDGLAFYNKQQNILIAGDAIFKESIGRTDLLGSNYDLLISNLKNKILTLPDNTIIYPGHGASTTILHEKTHNSFIQ